MLAPQFQLAELGYPVFPCVGKKPLTLSGFRAGTTDADQIDRWSKQWPNANWAIHTKGLLVVDVDPLGDGDNPWPEDYDKALDLAAAPISLTPRGGKHFIFRQPPGADIGSTVCKLAEHVDTRANGGYIVVPPSVVDGRDYRWLGDGLDMPPDELPLPPAWLLAALTGASKPKIEGPAVANRIPSGQRNAALASMAGHLRRAGCSINEMFALLSEVNANRCEPPLSEDEIRSKPWPDAAENTPGSVVLASPGSVVLLSAEDDIADTIRPRLDAAGANVRKVAALQGIQYGDDSPERCFNLESDLPVLEQAIQSSPDCRLIVIDPVSSYMGGVDSHKNSDVRGLIAPLAALASRYGVAVVMVTHFSKGQNRSAMHAPTGSIAYIAACRAAWAVIADKGDPERRLFLPIKNNLAKDVGGLAFKIVDRSVNGQPVGAVEWEPGPVNLSADDAMGEGPGGSRGPSMLELCKSWLFHYLTDEPKLADEVREAADDEGYSRATLKRAKIELGVRSVKDGFQGKATWKLPKHALNLAQAPTTQET